MAKKSKNASSRSQPNAPEFQQVLYQPNQQPPLNPYYTDSTCVHPTTQPPPPYSYSQARSQAAIYQPVPMSQLNDISYPRINNGQATPVVIQAPNIPYDYRGERRKSRIRRFNSQTMIIAILAIICSVYAYSLYSERPCIESFVVAKPSKDLTIRISDVRKLHLPVAYLSGVVFLLCLLKAGIGYHRENNCCYLFLISLATFYLTLHTACLAYLAFYSPCVPSVGDISLNIAKTFVSSFTDSVPSPDKGYFGESNVINTAKQDSQGLMIFIFDVINFVFYLSVFLTSMTAC